MTAPSVTGERTTSELILSLGDDVTRCHRELVEVVDNGQTNKNGNVYADHEYHSRQLIRVIFAFIEAFTFSVKASVAYYCVKNGRDISDGERYFSVDAEHKLNNNGVNGVVIERPAHIRLSDNIRFAFALQEKALGIEKPFDCSCEWWSQLQLSIKVRDRLTHPKLPGDIDVSSSEIVSALNAYEGFKRQMMIYVELRKSDS